ncbi:unnamed protein product, partial [Mesorhabditis spiculigera]
MGRRYIANYGRDTVEYTRPANDFVLRLPENTPIGKVVYNVMAIRRADAGNSSERIKYTATPLSSADEGYLDVDERTGDIFVTGALDYEKLRFITSTSRTPKLMANDPSPGRSKSPGVTNRIVIHLRQKRDGDFDQADLHTVVPKLVASELAAPNKKPQRSLETKPPRLIRDSEFIEVEKRSSGILRRQSSKRSEYVTSSDDGPGIRDKTMNIYLPGGTGLTGRQPESGEAGKERAGILKNGAGKKRTSTMSSGSSMGSPPGRKWSAGSQTELHIRIPDSPPSSASLSLLSSGPRPSIRIVRQDPDDSSGYESGYLSHIDLNTPDLLSRPGSELQRPESRQLKEPGRRPYRAESHDEIRAFRSPPDAPGSLARSATASHIGLSEQLVSGLRNRIDKTKFITCTFEAANAGLDTVLPDVVQELKRLKEAVHAVLRENNRAVLRAEDEAGDVKLSSDRLAESNTRENQRRNQRNDSFEGVYQRCYIHLLPYCHHDTAHWHHPYWDWESLDRNMPILPHAELFAARDTDPKTSTILALHLLLRAEHPLFEDSADERLLRVDLIDVDDNQPQIMQSPYTVFPAPLPAGETTKIGRIAAFDLDAEPFNHITYHLMPKCNQQYPELVEVDAATGVLSFTREVPKSVAEFETFCVLASPYETAHVSRLEYSPSNSSMLRFRLHFVADHFHFPQMPFRANNTVLTIDPDFEELRLPLAPPHNVPANVSFAIREFSFEPATYSAPTSTNSTPTLFSVDPQTGSLRISPFFGESEQGIYTIHTEAIDAKSGKPFASYLQNVHLVSDTQKVRLVSELAVPELAYNGEKLLRQLAAALQHEDPDRAVDVVGDRLEKYPGEKERAGLCVHVAKGGRVLSREEVVALIGQAVRRADSPLHNIYHIYKIVSVEACTPSTKNHDRLRSSSISNSWLFLLCITSVALLVMFAVTSYYCLVHRYRVRAQEKHRMRVQKGPFPSGTLPALPPSHLGLPPMY